MRRRGLSGARPFRAVMVLVVAGIGTANAEIPRPDDAPQPKSPEESRACFRLPDGFRIDLVAAEPIVVDPTGVAWDARGDLFVTELHGYNLEGHLDITELNRTGRLDTEVRRVRVGPELKEQARSGQRGTLKRLVDTDGDGRMDEAVVWADDLPPAYGVAAARGGVVVTCAPDIVFFGDTDGDGRPDVREVLFTGFETGELERGINNPVWGPDNWLYAGAGWGGGTITGPGLAEPVALGRGDFRFRADGSAIEPVSGANHTFGMAFDDWGNRWLITTSRHARYAAPLPHRYLVRNPHVSAPDTTVDAASYGNTFPASAPHPWRRKRGADPAWVAFYGAGETQPNGNFTSACGQMVYRADLFPARFLGNHFCCDPQQNLVHRSIIERDGPGLRVRRPEEESDSEFLASSDGWFRPINLRTGPDGALYVVDMYREIIEDYSAIPRFLQQQYGLLHGDDRGRLWRLAPAESPPSGVVVDDPAEVSSLAHANAWRRTTAQRLIVESGDASKGDAVRRLLRGREPSAFTTRIHALHTLDGLGVLGAGDLVTALGDPHPAVRLHALRLADRRSNDPAIRRAIAAMAADGAERDPAVVLQLALSLGETGDMAALAKVAAAHAGIRWLEAAVLSSVVEHPDAFLEAALASAVSVPPPILEGALETLARTGDRERLSAGLAALDRRGDPRARRRLLTIAARSGLADSPGIREAIDAAVAELPESRDEDVLPLLGHASAETLRPVLTALLASTADPGLAEEAVRAALAEPRDDVADILVAALAEATPRLAASLVETLLRFPGTTARLLDAGAGPARFSSLQRHRLLHHEDPSIRKRAEGLFAAPAAAPAEADGPRLARFRAALAGPADPGRGAAVFTSQCGTCHQFDGRGAAVGPPLDGEAGRPPESLLADILDPSARLTAGYATWLARTTDGASHVGVLTGESATGVTLGQPGGGTVTLLRRDLDSLEKLDISLMPATLAEALSPRDAADLLAYLGSRRPSGTVVLFDDDPGFAAALAEGNGSARLEWTEPAAGRACLTVEGFQRHARRIPGWDFPIRESPAEGEFRYLTVSVKNRGAPGILIEVADDGRFPPADQPVRTWFAGENTTGWRSNRLSASAPDTWETYSIDLWKGCGDYRLTGIALTVMGGAASFDRIELGRAPAARNEQSPER